MEGTYILLTFINKVVTLLRLYRNLFIYLFAFFRCYVAQLFCWTLYVLFVTISEAILTKFTIYVREEYISSVS